VPIDHAEAFQDSWRVSLCMRPAKRQSPASCGVQAGKDDGFCGERGKFRWQFLVDDER